MKGQQMVIKSVDDLGKGIHFIVTFDSREYSRVVNTDQSWAVLSSEDNGCKEYRGVTDRKAIDKLDRAFSRATFHGRQV